MGWGWWNGSSGYGVSDVRRDFLRHRYDLRRFVPRHDRSRRGTRSRFSTCPSRSARCPTCSIGSTRWGGIDRGSWICRKPNCGCGIWSCRKPSCDSGCATWCCPTPSCGCAIWSCRKPSCGFGCVTWYFPRPSYASGCAIWSRPKAPGYAVRVIRQWRKVHWCHVGHATWDCRRRSHSLRDHDPHRSRRCRRPLWYPEDRYDRYCQGPYDRCWCRHAARFRAARSRGAECGRGGGAAPNSSDARGSAKTRSGAGIPKRRGCSRPPKDSTNPSRSRRRMTRSSSYAGSNPPRSSSNLPQWPLLR